MYVYLVLQRVITLGYINSLIRGKRVPKRTRTHKKGVLREKIIFPSIFEIHVLGLGANRSSR